MEVFMSDVDSSVLLSNLEKIHTTPMGEVRIRRNLNLLDEDVVFWCCEKIKLPHSQIKRKGKNWYVTVDGSILTINAYSYTIITAHKEKV